MDRLGPRAEGDARPRRGRRGRRLEPVRQRRDRWRDLVLLATTRSRCRRTCSSRRRSRHEAHVPRRGIPIAGAAHGELQRRLPEWWWLHHDLPSKRGGLDKVPDHPAQRLWAPELRAVGNFSAFVTGHSSATPATSVRRSSIRTRKRATVDMGLDWGGLPVVASPSVPGWHPEGDQRSTNISATTTVRSRRAIPACSRTAASSRTFPATTGAHPRSGRERGFWDWNRSASAATSGG